MIDTVERGFYAVLRLLRVLFAWDLSKHALAWTSYRADMWTVSAYLLVSSLLFLIIAIFQHKKLEAMSYFKGRLYTDAALIMLFWGWAFGTIPLYLYMTLNFRTFEGWSLEPDDLWFDRVVYSSIALVVLTVWLFMYRFEKQSFPYAERVKGWGRFFKLFFNKYTFRFCLYILIWYVVYLGFTGQLAN